MDLKSFKNKKITVMGIGLHGGGIGVIKFLNDHGAQVTATDLRPKEELKSSLDQIASLPIKLVLSKHDLEDFTGADMIIKNPGVPDDSEFLKAARNAKVPIESDIGIFMELCPAPIIGVTGTRGKSTTAALLAHILGKHFPQVILAGNIRQSVLEKLPEITKDTIVVLELSSWQLADAKKHEKSPAVAILTNILPDHQNRYNDFADYIADKKLIFKFQKDKDYLFLNFDDLRLREIAKEVSSRIYFYSLSGYELLSAELPSLSQKARLGAYTSGNKIYYGAAQEEICDISLLSLPGAHNLANALAAVSVADLYNIPREKIREGLADFQGLTGRLELIAEFDGIKFINDTTATSPDAVIAALQALEPDPNANEPRKIILIAGGADKNLDFTPLGKIITEKTKAVILLEGTATDKFQKALPTELTVKKTDSMEKAVATAKRLANAGDIVLLSPGCASFGLFKHEFDRGQKFIESVQKLINP